jgi:hypothetical protein
MLLLVEVNYKQFADYRWQDLGGKSRYNLSDILCCFWRKVHYTTCKGERSSQIGSTPILVTSVHPSRQTDAPRFNPAKTRRTDRVASAQLGSKCPREVRKQWCVTAKYLSALPTARCSSETPYRGARGRCESARCHIARCSVTRRGKGGAGRGREARVGQGGLGGMGSGCQCPSYRSILPRLGKCRTGATRLHR